MGLQVPYRTDEDIERDADALLGHYSHVSGLKISPPIPIEDLVEKHLKLRVEFDDLHRLLDIPRSEFGSSPDVFGAIWLELGSIVIDESLDPEEHPELEGRYRFTLAHEGGGHWRLHRPFVQASRKQGVLFSVPDRPTVICRSSQAKQRIEWQADFYASCLLMPRKMVFAAWDEAFPDRKQRVLKPVTPMEHSFAEIARDPAEDENRVLDRFVKPFASRFLVSAMAMRIRLERLGLLHRAVPRQMFLA